MESDFYGASEYVCDFKYVLSSHYIIHSFIHFLYSLIHAQGHWEALGYPSVDWAGQGNTFMQIHTCRQFAAFSSPDLHFCEWEETGGNPYKHNKLTELNWMFIISDYSAQKLYHSPYIRRRTGLYYYCDIIVSFFFFTGFWSFVRQLYISISVI